MTEATTIWDILTAIGTVGAVVVALAFGGRAEFRLLSTERRKQASLVSAWLGSDEATFRHDDGVEVPFGNVTVVRVRNGSSSLIYNVMIHHEQPDKVQSPLRIDIVPPQEDRAVNADELVGDPWTIPFDLEFTDAAGRTWLRKPNGQLVELRRRLPRELRGRKDSSLVVCRQND